MKTFLLSAFALLWLGGCSTGRACTEIGCRDSAHLTFGPADNRWASGSYELTLVVGGQSSSCSFQVPEELPMEGSPEYLECTPSMEGGSVSMNPIVECHETRTDDAVSQTCAPVEEEYSLEVLLDGTPETVEVRLDRDGVVLVQRTLAVSYEATRPNGPECEPLCRQASSFVRIP